MKYVKYIIIILVLIGGVFFITTKGTAATDIVNDADLSTDLISCWNLDEESGTRADSVTGSGNDLDDINTVLFSSSCIQGNCADFENSTSEYLRITDANQTGLDLGASSADWAVSFWLNPESEGPDPVIFSKYKDGVANQRSWQHVNQVSVGQWIFQNSDDGTDSGIKTAAIAEDIGTGTWVHYVINMDTSAGEIIMYKNASLVSTTTGMNTTQFNGTADFILGARDTPTPSLFYDGRMDEFAVWSRRLGGDEIDALYNSGTGIPCAGGVVTAGGDFLFGLGF